MLSLTESLAEEWAGSGVTVTALCPGITATPMLTGAAAANLALSRLAAVLGACRTWGVDSEKRPQRGQFLSDLQPHSCSYGAKSR